MFRRRRVKADTALGDQSAPSEVPAEPDRGPTRPPDQRFLVDGATLEIAGRPGAIRRRSFGRLTLTGDRLIVCDPFDFRNAPEYLRQPVEAGDREVIGFVHDAGGGWSTVAVAALVLADRPVVHRRLGLVGSQDEADLGPGEYFGFGVDAGTACFADERAVTAALASAGVTDLPMWRGLPDSMADQRDLAAQLIDDVWHLFDTVDEQMVEALTDRTSVVTLTLPGSAAGTNNLVAFSAGFGDGSYPVWLGYDDQDRLVEVLADFLVLPRADHR